LLLTSATYQQTSDDRPAGREIDPENRLLWRMNRQRLEMEAWHDAMLAVSGSLEPTIGGRPVNLFAGQRRRAIYGFVNRLEFPSLWSTFDVPSPEATNARRVTTTTAPQALFLLNGPFARDAARKLIASPRIQKITTTPDRIDELFRVVSGRIPDAEERAWAEQFIGRKGPGDRWVDLAQALLMSNEFMFID
jgi:Protein of unknown function (DUF1553)